MKLPVMRWSVLGLCKWLLASILALVAASAMIVLCIAYSQDGSVKVLQSYLHSKWGFPPNSFEPRHRPRDEIRADGLRVRTEIAYGDQYPNSHMDLWYPDASTLPLRPVVIFLHGGGWFMGDKATGDPIANGGEPVESEPMATLAKSGFIVANLNYALTPSYRYPVQLTQLNQAIGFLRMHSAEFGIDMSRITIMGGSAGAHMAAQYGLILSDPAYAAELKIQPATDLSSVKALVLYSAPYNLYATAWRASTMAWAYLGTQDLKNSQQVRQADILSHVGPRYPSTYLTDGNQSDTFPELAKAMAAKLEENHVDYQFNYYEPSEALLGHGYTGEYATKHGRDNLEKTIAFIKRRTAPPAGAP